MGEAEMLLKDGSQTLDHADTSSFSHAMCMGLVWEDEAARVSGNAPSATRIIIPQHPLGASEGTIFAHDTRILHSGM